MSQQCPNLGRRGLSEATRERLGLIVDSPRKGLEREQHGFLISEGGPRTLLYLSCNLDLPIRDARLLESRHAPVRAWTYPLLPFTDHAETLVRFEARRDPLQLSVAARQSPMSGGGP